MGRPALRGAAREDLAEELNRLLKANRALRLDPVLREDRWTTITDLAKAADKRHLIEIRGGLDEAVTNVADNAAAANSARTEVEEHSESLADTAKPAR